MSHHLTLENREFIAQMRSGGCSQAEIARRLGRAESTISRELRRNRSRNGYWPVAAQKKADARQRRRPRAPKLNNPDLRQYVQQRLRWYWSPDEIAAKFRPPSASNGVPRLSIDAAATATGRVTPWWALIAAAGP